jgi:hypothetical protein
MQRRIVFLTILLAAVSLAVHAADLTGEVIDKAAGGVAQFIPASLLERGVDGVRLSPYDRGYLRHRIETANPETCAEVRFAHRPSVRAEDRRSLAKIMAESQRLFTGEVRAVVTGWSTSHHNVVTVVWVAPDSILEDPAGQLTGDAYAFVIQRGEARIAGMRFCNRNSDYDVPREGDRLLVSADELTADGRLFRGAYYFPMTGDEIRSMPFQGIVPFAKVQLRTALAAAASEKQAVQK